MRVVFLVGPVRVDLWLFTMSQVRVFSLVGDSNVKRHMNPTNCRDRPAMMEAQVIPCTKISVLQQSLRSVRDSSNVCIVSCISNFLSDSDSSASSMALRLEPIYLEFFRKLVQSCQAKPDRTFFVCPPMFRTSPGPESTITLLGNRMEWNRRSIGHWEFISGATVGVTYLSHSSFKLF